MVNSGKTVVQFVQHVRKHRRAVVVKWPFSIKSQTSAVPFFVLTSKLKNAQTVGNY